MIRIEGISKSYKNNQKVLNNISFSAEKGEVVVLVGTSGCGKTTTLKMINRLIEPTSGKIYIDGKDISTINPVELRINQGYVVQSTGLFPHLTIKENIELVSKLTKSEQKKDCIPVDELMNIIGMDGKKFLHRYPVQLSGGQQQRIGVARALRMNPDILLMDEPFSAVDPITRLALQDELINIQKRLKKTIIFVTHDMDEAIKIADKICIMNKGHIVQFDTPEKILKNPATEFVEKFVGKGRIWTKPEYITAEDICIKEPVTAENDISVLRAAEFMQSKKVDSLIIVDEKKRYKGIMSVYNFKKGVSRDTPIKDMVMSQHKTVRPDESLYSILELFKKGESILPVVDKEGMLSGLITRSCLVNTLSQQYIGEEV